MSDSTLWNGDKQMMLANVLSVHRDADRLQLIDYMLTEDGEWLEERERQFAQFVYNAGREVQTPLPMNSQQ